MAFFALSIASAFSTYKADELKGAQPACSAPGSVSPAKNQPRFLVSQQIESWPKASTELLEISFLCTRAEITNRGCASSSVVEQALQRASRSAPTAALHRNTAMGLFLPGMVTPLCQHRLP